jgi:outer membrane protein OmpA-like peptidoglycan-associated protein
MRIRSIFVLLVWFISTFILAAQTPVEGFCFEENNRGFLNQVKVSVFNLETGILQAEAVSDLEGKFSILLPAGDYRLSAVKELFETKADSFRVGNEKTYLKVEMKRKPGYLFDATVAEARQHPDQVVDALSGLWIEIYNRTKMRPELVLRNHPNAFFQHTFEQGNHYTVLLRKSGFLAKRIEAYINVKDCILCIEGIRDLSPGVSENLAAGNQLGTLLSNIEMERVKLDMRIQLQNIYYDYDKWDIRPDAAIRLDNAVQLMRDNPNLTVELGSHTDARGGDAYNLDLSKKRAAAAVAYIVAQGIPAERITSQGYGETKIMNRCANGVACSDEEHERNRRTELRITGIMEYPEEYWTSLEDMIKREIGAGPMSPTQRAALLKELSEGKRITPGTQVQISGSSHDHTGPSAPSTSQHSEDVKTPQVVLNDSIVAASRTLQAPFAWLPSEYTGYAIQLAQSISLLPAEAPALLKHPEIYIREEKSGYVYYILFKNRLNEAYKQYNTQVKKQNEEAKMVAFRKGEKTFLK